MSKKNKKSEATEPEKKRGWGNPPQEYWWPKGVSGNPSGRPKGSKTLRTVIAEALDRETVVKTDHGLQKMTWREAQAIKAHQASLNGNYRYTDLILACEEAYIVTQTDTRSESERQADIARILLLAFLEGPDNLEGVNDEGQIIDQDGKIWTPEDIFREKLRKKETKERD